MPGQRSKDQRLIPVPMSEEFVGEINAAVKKSGYPTRAQFIRDAIVEKITALGIKLPPGIGVPPPAFDRPKADRMGERSSGLYSGKISSKAKPSDLSLVDAAEAVADNPGQESTRLNEVASPTGQKHPPSGGVSGKSKVRRGPAKRAPK